MHRDHGRSRTFHKNASTGVAFRTFYLEQPRAMDFYIFNDYPTCRADIHRPRCTTMPAEVAICCWSSSFR